MGWCIFPHGNRRMQRAARPMCIDGCEVRNSGRRAGNQQASFQPTELALHDVRDDSRDSAELRFERVCSTSPSLGLCGIEDLRGKAVFVKNFRASRCSYPVR